MSLGSLSLLFLLAATPARAVEVEVFVPLCDRAQLACGRAGAGEPRSLEANLYWGAAYGVERYLKRAPGFQVRSRQDGAADAPVLRELVLERTAGPSERPVRLRLRAYAGDRIDDALEDFLRAAAGGSSADLLVWAGHDRLMDRIRPTSTVGRRGRDRATRKGWHEKRESSGRRGSVVGSAVGWTRQASRPKKECHPSD